MRSRVSGYIGCYIGIGGRYRRFMRSTGICRVVIMQVTGRSIVIIKDYSYVNREEEIGCVYQS